MTDPQTTASDAASETPLVSLYRRIIVPLVRGATVLVVVFFLLGGIGGGVGVMDVLYGEDPQLESNGVSYSCSPKSEAGPGDRVCRYPTAVAKVIGAAGGGVVGLAAGLIATFSIEVGVTVYLASRKYLRS
jgi:hypothetical protein